MGHLFSGHHVLEVEYARDLNEEFDATMVKVMRFLGVPVHPLCRQLKKQAAAPLNERIQNYDQLRSHFHGTQYAKFFLQEDD